MVKRLEMNHKGLPEFDENGTWVFFSDYSALQQKLDSESLEKDYNADQIIYWKDQAGLLKQKLDAMAAENAALKQIAMEYANLADSRLSEMTANCESDCSMECYDLTSKLPATDAYLNSVRVEGVEMLALAHQKIVDSLDGDSLFADFERKHKNICSAAITFADKLSSGIHDTADKAG